MNMYALIAGIALIVFVIWCFRKTRLDRSKWTYPFLLASFSFFYFSFAIFAKDFSALGHELLISLFFFLLVFLAIRSQPKTSAILVGVGCILHGLYDVYHNTLFLNTGAPYWWAEFCGSVDMLLGIYLIYVAATRFRLEQHEENTGTV